MSKLTLSAVGLSPQEGTVVNVVANLMAALDHSVKVLDAGDITGDIVLISEASEAGRAVLGHLGKEQRAVLFVDGENDANVNDHIALARPVRVQTLRDLLVELVPHLPVRTQGAAPAQPAAPAARASAASPAAAHTDNLFYLLLRSVIDRTLVRIEGKNVGVVLIHGPSQCIYTQADGAALEPMSKLAGDELHARVLPESDFMQAAKGLPLTRLHDLIWLAERNGSRGALLKGHSLDVPVRLKVWPKFNSRHVRPEYLKLAALLSRQPLTLRTLAEAGHVALPHVIDFYNASVAFGVIEKMETAPVVIPPTKPSAGSGLLGKIARRLALKRD